MCAAGLQATHAGEAISEQQLCYEKPVNTVYVCFSIKHTHSLPVPRLDSIFVSVGAPVEVPFGEGVVSVHRGGQEAAGRPAGCGHADEQVPRRRDAGVVPQRQGIRQPGPDAQVRGWT